MIHVKRGNVIVLGSGGGGGGRAGSSSSSSSPSLLRSWITGLLFFVILLLQVYQVVRMDVQLNANNSGNDSSGRQYYMQEFIRGPPSSSNATESTVSTSSSSSSSISLLTPAAAAAAAAAYPRTASSTYLRTRTAAVPHNDNEENFSACLMLMDDNAHLIEWLAYHYYALPLRRLIVAVDPRSQTSPTEILHRWQDAGLMQITEWSDVDFMPPTLMDAHLQTDIKNDSEALTKLFRQRQEEFYTRCMARLKVEGKTWVALVDTDEYISPNTLHSRKYYAYLQQKQKQQQQQQQNGHVTVMDLLHPKEHHPPITQESSEVTSVDPLVAAMKQETQLAQQLQASPCFPMVRLGFGVKESTKEELYYASSNTYIPWGFDPHFFQTLRWRWHAGRSKKSVNKISKALMDVSRVDSSLFVPTKQVMVHLPIQEYCNGEDDLWILNSQSLLVVHHYGGTWEQWSHRSADPRNKRTREAYDKMKYDKETDDSIRPWLAGFVNQVGWWTARRLLQNVGKV